VLSFETVTEAEGLDPHLDDWSALAVAAGRPFCLPGWMLAWWRHAGPPRAELRTVLVHDGSALVGVAPYFADPGPAGRTDYRLLASGTSQPIGPLAAAGRAREVAEAVAVALASARPGASLVTFEGVEAGSPWPAAIRRAWPGPLRPHRYRASRLPTPVLDLAGAGFEAWLAGKSQNFRQQMRRARRRAAERGTIALATEPQEVERAAAAFADLHHARWRERGGSNLDPATARALLADAGRALTPEHLRLWTVEVDGELASVQVFAAAGGEVVYWNGGWAEQHAALKPALVGILAAVEDAFARGERRIDFGAGEHPYKLRFAGAGEDEAVVWTGLFPLGPRYPVTRAQVLPAQLGWLARGAARRLPEARRERLKRLLRRGGGASS
jgi:CelD/BcsL family acetyltransferase involved in cellulose biosynthesis